MFQTQQVSHLKCWEGTCEEETAWTFNRHRDSLDITDEELGTSIVSVNTQMFVFSFLTSSYHSALSHQITSCFVFYWFSLSFAAEQQKAI